MRQPNPDRARTQQQQQQQQQQATHSWKYVSATVMKAVTSMRMRNTMNRML
jgi:hypothetical protein